MHFQRSFYTCLTITILLHYVYSIDYKFGDHLRSIDLQNDPLRNVNVWVFFDSKPNTVQSRSAVDDRVVAKLDPKAVARRTKTQAVSGTKSIVHETDVPVDEDYVKQTMNAAGRGSKHRTTSNWLNAISITTSLQRVTHISALPFVKEIELVAISRRNKLILSEEISSKQQRDANQFGPSFTQLNIMDEVNMILSGAGDGGSGAKVLVIDSGFNVFHEAFDFLNITGQQDFIHGINGSVGNLPNEDSSQTDHGTAVLSVMAGKKDGRIYGPAYKAQVMLAKTEVVDSENMIEEDWFVQALEWGEASGADIVSASLGYTDWYTKDQIDGKTAVTTKGCNIAVSEKGLVVVISAGNEGASGIAPPGDSPYVLTVGAVDQFSQLAYFSSRGPTYDGVIKPEVCAMGVTTYCADASGFNKYKTLSGTSLSTPLVAGLVAQLLTTHPEWTYSQVREALLETASRNDHPDSNYGWGVVNGTGAINFDAPICPNSCGHGACIDANCVCDIDYFGYDCTLHKSGCPKACVHGDCAMGFCQCNEGYNGTDCSIPVASANSFSYGWVNLLVSVGFTLLMRILINDI